MERFLKIYNKKTFEKINIIILEKIKIYCRLTIILLIFNLFKKTKRIMKKTINVNLIMKKPN